VSDAFAGACATRCAWAVVDPNASEVTLVSISSLRLMVPSPCWLTWGAVATYLTMAIAKAP
jgi:hypothetical protein